MNRNLFWNFILGAVIAFSFLWIGGTASSSVVPLDGYFSEQPIPCKVYLTIKNNVEEKQGVDTGKTIFQAKVQIIGEPLMPKEAGDKALRVKIVEVLEGTAPSESFIANYSAPSGHSGMPYNYEASKYYFIVGSGLGGKIFLKRIPGWTGKFSLKEWLWNLFSECETIGN